MYSELFKLLGYDQDEIEKERPRIDKAFKILDIGPEDIKGAEKRVRENFDTELAGARKMWRLWLKEFINLVLTKEEGKRWIYTPSPPYPLVIDTLRFASEDRSVYVSPITWFTGFVMGAIFDKLTPILEAGEAAGLGPGQAHCSFNQQDLGVMAKGVVPIPDLVVNYRYFCDQGAEAAELVNWHWGTPMVYIDYSPDLDPRQPYEKFAERQVRYFGGEIRRAFERAGEIMGYEVKEEHKQETMAQNGALWMAIQSLVNLLREADPMPLGLVELAFVCWSTFVIPDKNELIEVVKTMTEEVKERIAKGEGRVEKGAPRIYWFVPTMADITLMRMVDKLGLACPNALFAWLSPDELTPLQSTTIEEQMAEFTINRGLFRGSLPCVQYMEDVCKAFELDGAVVSYMFSCRVVGTPPMMAKKQLKEKLGIPVLALEMDPQDLRDYSPGQLRTRVETFAELLKARKAATSRAA